jgi:hypothetical protein
METEDDFVAKIIAESGRLAPVTPDAVAAADQEAVLPQSGIRFEGFGLPSVACISSGRVRDRFRELRVTATLPSSLQRKRRIRVRGGAETVASRLRAEFAREKIAEEVESSGKDTFVDIAKR